MDACPICMSPASVGPCGNRDAKTVRCPRCGTFHISGSADVNMGQYVLNDRQRATASTWIRDNSGYDISSAGLNSLFSLPAYTFQQKSDRFMFYLDNLTKFAGEEIPISRDDPSVLGASGCINRMEVNEVIMYLVSTNRIRENGGGSSITICPDGWSYLESIRRHRKDSLQCFVAMWFSNDMHPVYSDAISLAISDAGYNPLRVDQREHNDKIDDEIIVQIQRSKFIVADFTGHRGGVYFEAGFAKGLGMEVFWTCREDHVGDLHFDIRQYNCILWQQDKLEEFRQRLSRRIEAVLGKGTYRA